MLVKAQLGVVVCLIVLIALVAPVAMPAASAGRRPPPPPSGPIWTQIAVPSSCSAGTDQEEYIFTRDDNRDGIADAVFFLTEGRDIMLIDVWPYPIVQMVTPARALWRMSIGFYGYTINTQNPCTVGAFVTWNLLLNSGNAYQGASPHVTMNADLTLYNGDQMTVLEIQGYNAGQQYTTNLQQWHTQSGLWLGQLSPHGEFIGNLDYTGWWPPSIDDYASQIQTSGHPNLPAPIVATELISSGVRGTLLVNTPSYPAKAQLYWSPPVDSADFTSGHWYVFMYQGATFAAT